MITQTQKLIGLIAVKVAEGDEKGAMRIYVENRISKQTYLEARAIGLKFKEAGVVA